jgi:hypothetical protein
MVGGMMGTAVPENLPLLLLISPPPPPPSWLISSSLKFLFLGNAVNTAVTTSVLMMIMARWLQGMVENTYTVDGSETT